MADYSAWENTLSRDVESLVVNYFNDTKPGDVIYDVGANVGVFSDKVLDRYKDVQLVLFEPVRDYYEYLKEKYSNNSNVKIYNFALVERERPLAICRDLHNLGYNTISEIQMYGSIENIKGVSLSDIIKSENLPLPNLIKVDVEESEYLFILGCKELFKYHLPRKIVMEVGILKSNSLWEKEKEMMEYIFSMGYRRFEYTEYTHTYEAVFILE